MFTRSSKWNVKSIILVALIGIIMGVIYTYGFNNIYNVAKISLLPTGYASVIDTIFSGLNSNVNLNNPVGTPAQSANTNSGANASPSLPPSFSGVSFTNIEIPDFLKK